MSRHLIIITEPYLQSPQWQQLSYPVTILETVPDELPDECVALVLAGMENWQEMVKTLSARNAQVLVMSRELKVEELNNAFNCGAHGYIELFATAKIIEQAVETVTSGALWLPGRMLPNLVGVLSVAFNRATGCNLEALSKREREVTHLVCDGALNKEIAERLFISERTVKQHLTSIFQKLGVKDRMQLMMAVKGR